MYIPVNANDASELWIITHMMRKMSQLTFRVSYVIQIDLYIYTELCIYRFICVHIVYKIIRTYIHMYIYIYIRRLCLLSALLLMHNPHDTYKSRDFVHA